MATSTITPTSAGVPLTFRFSEAVRFAAELHNHNRKATNVPYVAHLLAVCALVLGENGYRGVEVTEDMAIAALLHDAAEDHGGEPVLAGIGRRFGAAVARMVRECSDSLGAAGAEKGPWRERKEEHVARVPQLPADTRLIMTADKLDNARATFLDYLEIGEQVWQRFKAGKEGTLWYLKAMAAALTAAGRNRLTEELDRVVTELRARSARSPEEEARIVERFLKRHRENILRAASELKPFSETE
jgi:(p)ppGpp synthase/HD superfamily hydrolase